MGTFIKGTPSTYLNLILLFAIPITIATVFMRWLGRKVRQWPILAALPFLTLVYGIWLTLIIMDIAYIFRNEIGGLSWLKHSWYLYPLCYVFILITIGVRGIIRKLGPGVFWHWVRGYYYYPREETRIFMFLDMRDSTTLAEKLGHVKFGALLRDFMADLSEAVAASKGEVSHYIGDEAVLTWLPKKGFTDGRCIECFYRFKAILEKRRAHYERHFGLFPEFKAGLHYGTVTATEVGEIKSEIVFLGDVLNTTARIQAACKEFDAEFLISAEAAEHIPPLLWLNLIAVGGAELKGKEKPVELVKVELAMNPS